MKRYMSQTHTGKWVYRRKLSPTDAERYGRTHLSQQATTKDYEQAKKQFATIHKEFEADWKAYREFKRVNTPVSTSNLSIEDQLALEIGRTAIRLHKLFGLVAPIQR